jgi:exo-1,4-beta-D-glucosaminidase
VTQTVEYYTTLFDAMNRRYGEPDGIEAFCRTARVMNYNSARGMYEAYGRNKPDANGITTWKYDVAWPATLTWQYVDWYLDTTGAYFGAQKACEPLHVQYAYDDKSVYVVSAPDGVAHKDLVVSGTLYDFNLKSHQSEEEVLSVEPDSVVKAFEVEVPGGITDTHFLHLELRDANGELLSDNFYWLSTTPDVDGRRIHRDGVFHVEPKSSNDFTMLNDLPPVEVEAEAHFETDGDGYEVTAAVVVRNPSDNLAFFIDLALVDQGSGEVVRPVFWSENCFSLLPGQSKTVSADFYMRDLSKPGANVELRVGGWNVTAR